jgi:hypothetical protein
MDECWINGEREGERERESECVCVCVSLAYHWSEVGELMGTVAAEYSRSLGKGTPIDNDG